MKIAIMMAGIVIAGIVGLLFAARSFRRLCQGKFLSAIAAFFLMAVLFAFIALSFSLLTSQATMKTTPIDKSSQVDEKTGEPQPSVRK